MSAPAMLGLIAAALAIGVPVAVASARAEASHRASGAADGAALAAADAGTGYTDGEPCDIAGSVAAASGARVSSCTVDPGAFEARIVVEVPAVFGAVEGRARAGASPPPPASSGGGGSGGALAADGWAWPSGIRAVTQGPHDGYAIDLAVDGSGVLYAPYRGIVVRLGDDGNGIPEPCRVRPEWWRGPNQTVIVRHEYRGAVLFSSHNHLVPGSSARAGIALGSAVSAGQPIGAAGSSGCTSGPHSHFTLSTGLRNTNPDLDPFLYIGTP